jgi:hypothetical protein
LELGHQILGQFIQVGSEAQERASDIAQIGAAPVFPRFRLASPTHTSIAGEKRHQFCSSQVRSLLGSKVHPESKQFHILRKNLLENFSNYSTRCSNSGFHGKSQRAEDFLKTIKQFHILRLDFTLKALPKSISSEFKIRAFSASGSAANQREVP